MQHMATRTGPTRMRAMFDKEPSALIPRTVRQRDHPSHAQHQSSYQPLVVNNNGVGAMLPLRLTDVFFCTLTEVFSSSCYPKDLNMAGAQVIVPESLKMKSNRFHMVTWLNNLLKTNFKDVRNTGSGDKEV